MLTLLAVEDREDIRKLLDVILGDSYRVHLAENGINAIEILDANEIDIVILDLGLPDFSGFEVLKYIKNYIKDEWRKNKKYIGYGTFEYTCQYVNRSGEKCNKAVYSQLDDKKYNQNNYKNKT